mgnify:CR=1 FL=1
MTWATRLDILFGTDDPAAELNSQRGLDRRYGTARAKLIRRRLDDLRAATVLNDMRHLPGRCHELKYDRKGQLVVHLDGPYGLVFEPANEPVPRLPNGGLDWTRITAVRIIGVEDYHDG